MAEPRGRATDEDQEDREARRIEAAIQGAEDMRVWTGRGDQNGELDQEAERLVDARQRIKAETSIRPRKPLPKVSE